MKITAAHGSGGLETARLVQEIFASTFGSGTEDDAAVVAMPGRVAFTTDSYVVKPLFFRGGDIGRLAVCGTVNDLLTSGAEPRYLSAAFIIEEGADTADLLTIAQSMRAAADEAGVKIVTGDTKVVEGGGGVYVTTAGVGALDGAAWALRDACAGDRILVTGALGSHHACVMSARMGIENEIESDVAPLTEIAAALKRSGAAVRGVRDITRGGLATTLNEAAAAAGLQAVLTEAALPVDADVAGLCAILGLEPLYMANEGKMLAIVAEADAEQALAAVRAARYGGQAAIVGRFTAGAGVVMETAIGGRRNIPPLVGESLPRIC